MKYPIPFIVLAAIMTSCAANNPVAPATGDLNSPSLQKMNAVYGSQHRLWGEFKFILNDAHNRIDIEPIRQARVHLNALKFLEEGGKNFLKITGIKNNGDGTIDVKIKITHPFPGHPEFTGFDVKGIIMFQGSHETKSPPVSPYPQGGFRISWKEKGDPELLNPDGYSPRWTEWWDSGSSLPIFNYWPGKFANGEPSANLNAYREFYTDEDRHVFRVTSQIENTYHIWFPPGPHAMRYAVEACWEPPIKTPVIDPITDFPESANQEEPYFFDIVVNNGQPITVPECCGSTTDCDELWIELKQWWGMEPGNSDIFPDKFTGVGSYLLTCPDNPDFIFPKGGVMLTDHGQAPDGDYRGVAMVYYYKWENGEDIYRSIAYTVFDYVIDL